MRRKVRLKMKKRRIYRRLRGQRLGAEVELVIEQTADCMSIYARMSIHTRMSTQEWAFMQNGHLWRDSHLGKDRHLCKVYSIFAREVQVFSW